MTTAVVTGATRGIGRAVAIALGRRGMDVAITGRTRREGDAALPGSHESSVEAVEAAGGRAVPIVLDLSDADSVEAAADEAVAALGTVDIVLNNAIYVGPAGLARFLDTPRDEIEKRLFGNVTAQLLFTQPLLRHMTAPGTGTIGFTASGSGYAPPTAPPGEGGWALTYGVSKAAPHRIAEQLVVEQRTFASTTCNRARLRRNVSWPGGSALQFVAQRAAPLDAVGEAIAGSLRRMTAHSPTSR